MIPLLLALLVAGPAPVACPEGAVRGGGQPPDLQEEWCEARAPDGGGAVREGPARTYYDDGGVWVESGYHRGKLEGAFVERHRGGKLARQGAYHDGLRSGTWRFYYEDGTLEEESSWTRGTPDGPFADFWPSGRRRTVGRRCGGVQCGRWDSYDDSGALIGSVEYAEQIVP
jgi:antitoxin component YwqK of YwqJK toxin-antitoxin module